MGILDRLMTMIKAKISTFLDRHEDPRETLDYSYEKQLELLTNVKRGIADVVTAKKRLELQKAKLESNIESLNNQQIESLTAQIADLENEQTKLVNTERKLSAKVEAFRTKKETIKAQYSAAEAQVKITESVTGISEEMADVGMSVQRAEEKTETMKARSQALDELIDSGTLEDLTSDQTKVEEELSKIKSSDEVDQELQILKQEVTTKKKAKTEETQEAQQ